MPSQLTPPSWGRVYWGGGPGRPGDMGGWRISCTWCAVGNGLTAFPRKLVADVYLSNHCIEKHSHKTVVRVLTAPTEAALAQTTTGTDDSSETSS